MTERMKILTKSQRNYIINIGRGEIMEPVRETYHKGYRHKDGTPFPPEHNDRNGYEKPNSASGNFYMNFAGHEYLDNEKVYYRHDEKDNMKTFLDGEIACYEKKFRPHIKVQNARNKKGRHPERNVSLKQYYEKHPPEETLFYLGNMDNYVEPRKLLEVFVEYLKWLETFRKKDYGIEVLNAALHTDENEACHIQNRQIYYYTDKDGNLQISQNKALEMLGFERPDPTREIDKYNNAKQTFTAICREKLFEIAKSHGVELITEPLPREEVGKSLDEYIARDNLRKENKALEKRKEDLERRESSLTIDEKAWKEEQKTLRAEKENAKQELEKMKKKQKALCVETEKAKQDLEKVREDVVCEVQKLGGLKAYNEFRKAERDEKAKQEAERKAQEERERQEKIAAEREQLKRDMQERIQAAFQEAPETTEDEKPIPEHPKYKSPLKTILDGLMMMTKIVTLRLST